MKRYDVIIAGGGPSGAVAAFTAGHGLKVLVVEKRRLLEDPLPAEEKKCCGGMLDDSAQKALTELGISLPRKVLMAPNVFCVRAVDFENRMERYYQRNYLNINRDELDNLLLRKAAAKPGVEVWCQSRVIAPTLQIGREGAAVWVDHQGVREKVFARVLIGADGSTGGLRGQILKKKYGNSEGLGAHDGFRAPKKYAALQEIFPAGSPLPYYMAVFDERVTDYYSWVIPKGDTILVGSAIPKASAGRLSVSERFEILKKDLQIKGFDLSRPLERQGSLILRPQATNSITAGYGCVLLSGEAAGLISPSSSEGISFAIRSGKAAARAVSESFLHGTDVLKAYERNLTSLKSLIALKTLKSPVMYQKDLRRAVFLSGATALKMDHNPPESGRWS